MNILITYRHFPVAIGRYIHWALESRGHTVFSVGPYSGAKIPWGDEFSFPHHAMPPDLQTPDTYIAADDVMKKCPIKIDVVIQCGDTFWLRGKLPCKHIVVATDPHVIDYHDRLVYANAFVSMQKYYLKDYEKGYWMPYGYDSNIHKNLHKAARYDVVFIGLQYENRIRFMAEMKQRGYKVFNKLGLIYDEYVEAYNDGSIAFNWSSAKDLPARFWEGMAMGRMVLTNHVPDLENIDLVNGRDYVSYTTLEEALEKAQFYLGHTFQLEKIAESGYKAVKPHTWLNRVKILEDII